MIKYPHSILTNRHSKSHQLHCIFQPTIINAMVAIRNVFTFRHRIQQRWEQRKYPRPKADILPWLPLWRNINEELSEAIIYLLFKTLKELFKNVIPSQFGTFPISYVLGNKYYDFQIKVIISALFLMPHCMSLRTQLDIFRAYADAHMNAEYQRKKKINKKYRVR